MPPKVARAVPGDPSGSEIQAAAAAAISRLAGDWRLEGEELLIAQHFVRLKANKAVMKGWWWKVSKKSNLRNKSLEEVFLFHAYKSVQKRQRKAKKAYTSVEKGDRDTRRESQ